MSPTFTTRQSRNDSQCRRCDGCGLPAGSSELQSSSSSPSWSSADQAQLPQAPPLLRCSRCHNAWYHDVNCQRRHYKQHKKQCKALAASRCFTNGVQISPSSSETEGAATSSDVAQSLPKKKEGEEANNDNLSTITSMTTTTTTTMIHCEEHKGKGRCVFSSRHIHSGERIRGNIDGYNFSGTTETSTKSNRNCDAQKEGTAMNKRNWCFEPLVPPVLHRDHRDTRCAICFRQLASESSTTPTPTTQVGGYGTTHFPIWICSDECRQEGQMWFIDEEARAIVTFYSEYFLHKTRKGKGGSGCSGADNHNSSSSLPSSSRDNHCSWPRIGPTALLLYRLLRAVMTMEGNGTDVQSEIRNTKSRTAVVVSRHLPGGVPNIRDFIANLQSNRNSMSDEECTCARTVVDTVRHLIMYSKWFQNLDEQHSVENHCTIDYMMELVFKIFTNGFSIVDGESIPIGLGVFKGMASMINHSCMPNVVQTFSYGERGTLPSLLLTACRDIKVGEEVCIGYIDYSCPRERRRKLLHKEYKFWCTCVRCRDDKVDDLIVGMKCPHSGCNGLGRRVRAISNESHGKDDTCRLVCDKCGVDNFDGALQKRDTAFSTVEKLSNVGPYRNLHKPESTVTGPNARIHTADTMRKSIELRKSYETLKECCFSSSWYVHESGEALVQSLLDSISDYKTEAEKREMCSHALFTIDELLCSTPTSVMIDEGSSALRSSILLYKAAKLRLYLYPNPHQALTELQNVRQKLLVYFPKTHEIISGVEQCLAQAIM